MYKVYSGYNEVANGTFRVGEIEVSPIDLIRAFGLPGKSDNYKVSGEYVFHDVKTGAVFTIYDWKLTSLYSEGRISPNNFWKMDDKITFNVGGNRKHDAEEFISKVNNYIKWVKEGGRELEKEILQLPADNDTFKPVSETINTCENDVIES